MRSCFEQRCDFSDRLLCQRAIQKICRRTLKLDAIADQGTNRIRTEGQTTLAYCNDMSDSGDYEEEMDECQKHSEVRHMQPISMLLCLCNNSLIFGNDWSLFICFLSKATISRTDARGSLGFEADVCHSRAKGTLTNLGGGPCFSLYIVLPISFFVEHNFWAQRVNSNPRANAQHVEPSPYHNLYIPIVAVCLSPAPRSDLRIVS